MTSSTGNPPSSADSILAEFDSHQRQYGEGTGIVSRDSRSRIHMYWLMPANAKGDPYDRLVCNGPEVQTDSPRYSQWLAKGRIPLPQFGQELQGSESSREFNGVNWLRKFLANGGATAMKPNKPDEYILSPEQAVDNGLHKGKEFLEQRPDVAAYLGINPGDPVPEYACDFCKTFRSASQAKVEAHIRGNVNCRDSFARNGASIRASQQSAHSLTALAEAFGRTNIAPPSPSDPAEIINQIKGNPALLDALRIALKEEGTKPVTNK